SPSQVNSSTFVTPVPPPPSSCCFAPHPPLIGCQQSKQLQLQPSPPPPPPLAAAPSCRVFDLPYPAQPPPPPVYVLTDPGQHIHHDGRRGCLLLLQRLSVWRLRAALRVPRRAHPRREQETQKKKVQPKIAISVTGGVSRNSTATPPRHSNGSLTPPVTPPITPSSSFRSSTPTGSECDEEEVEYEDSDSDESWTTESAISSESILSSMCMNGGDEKPFACPVPGCKKRYKNVNGIKYHAKNGHRTQIRVRKPFKCRCGKSYKTSQGLRHHTINFHPPL
ncbi:hypothetical protein DNTS_005551, partial [Danionella cerebrum]